MKLKKSYQKICAYIMQIQAGKMVVPGERNFKQLNFCLITLKCMSIKFKFKLRASLFKKAQQLCSFVLWLDIITLTNIKYNRTSNI